MALARALLWLRFRLLRNGLKGGRTRDAVEQFSRAAAVVAPLMGIALFVPLAIASVWLGVIAGHELALGDEPRNVEMGLRYAAITTLVIVVTAIVFRAQQPETLTLTRLITLPISRRALHGIEIISKLLDPWLAVVTPGLLALSAGLLLGGKLLAASIALLASLALLLALASAMTLLATGAAIVLSHRRRREAFAAVAISSICLLPMVTLLLMSSDDPSRAHHDEAIAAASWLRFAPTEPFVKAVMEGASGETNGALLAVLRLSLLALPIFLLSYALYSRLLGNPSSGTAPRARSVPFRDLPLPWLSPGAAAVASVQVSTMLRSVQGKITFLLSPVIFGGVTTVLVRKVPSEALPFLPHDGVLVAGAGLLLVLLSAVGLMVNQMGGDRTGLMLSLLSPLSDMDIVLGKAAGFAILLGISDVILLAIVFLAMPGDPLALWVSLPIAAAGAYLPIAPVCCLLSAVLPRAIERVDLPGATKPHELAALAGFFLPSLGALPPAGILLHAVRVAHRPALAPFTLAAWLVLAAAISVPLFALAAQTLGARRDNLALVAQGR